MNILEVKNLSICTKEHKIINNINFTIKENTKTGLLGKSGEGKTLTMYALTNLLPKDKFNISGSIILNGKDILLMDNKTRSSYCSKYISIILQNSINALNPYKKISVQFMETIKLHEKKSSEKTVLEAYSILKELGMSGNPDMYKKYPYEFSGGMRQRIAVVLSLLCKPKLLIADEPTTSLDTINQSKFIQYINYICKQRKIALLYISHNPALIGKLCENVLVLNCGNIIEKGKITEVFKNPVRSFTKTLLKTAKELSSEDI